jgi:peptidoglycan hydrolase-like protein with peptidoglycan-binding domain
MTSAPPSRDLASEDLWRYSHERAQRRRAAARHRRTVKRISVPLAVAATAVGANATGLAAPAQAAGKTRSRVHPQRILRPGASGPEVVHLQRLLGVHADGDFGPSTLRAVRRFQATHGLLVDGQVGPHTWAALEAEWRGFAGEAVLREGDSGQAVAAVQRLLGVTPDGDFGPITLAAVRGFQASHGLVVDGQVGTHTLAALRRGRVVSTRHHHSAPPRRAEGVGARAVGIAERYLGVPYLWGGASPSGFDCSGLVMYVYAQLGVHLPHFAAAQFRDGRHVRMDQLRRGDLVFFDDLNHVGIYIGGGRFIHAPHTGDHVRISSLSSGWYAENYDGATRVA